MYLKYHVKLYKLSSDMIWLNRAYLYGNNVFLVKEMCNDVGEVQCT